MKLRTLEISNKENTNGKEKEDEKKNLIMFFALKNRKKIHIEKKTSKLNLFMR